MFEGMKKEFVAHKIRTAPVEETVDKIMDVAKLILKSEGDIVKAISAALKRNANEVATIAIAVVKIKEDVEKTLMDDIKNIESGFLKSNEETEEIKTLWETWRE